MQPTIQIIQPHTDTQYGHVRSLIRAFIHWHRQRHTDSSLTNDYFDQVTLEQEIAALPAKYATGRNRLLLALYEGRPAGCVALREIDAHCCEMKRMFVYEKFHGRGIGRSLALEIIRMATELGYATMRLDTSFRQTEALQLYETLGFKKIAPYYTLPKSVQDSLVFMELKL